MDELKLYQYLENPVRIYSETVFSLIDNLNHAPDLDGDGAEFAVFTLDLSEAVSYLEQVAEYMREMEKADGRV